MEKKKKKCIKRKKITIAKYWCKLQLSFKFVEMTPIFPNVANAMFYFGDS